MAQLQVTVKNLNKRKSPVTDFADKSNVVEVLKKDYVFESVGEITNVMGKWHVHKDGNFTWEKGVGEIISKENKSPVNFQTVVNSSFNGQKLISTIDYNALLDIPDSLKLNRGDNVIIGILDHPISMSLKLKNDIIRPFHTADPLFNFHSNFISGIIAGVKDIIGISNKVNIMELPIFNERATSNGIDIDKVIKFINDFDKPMILNISSCMDSGFNDSIKNLRKDIVVVASAGIDDRLTSNLIFNPATQENAIAIGAINKTFERNNLNRKVDFIIPNFNYVSYGKNMDSFTDGVGDSFSCAIVSSIIALLISSGKVAFDVVAIRKELVNFCQAYSNILSLDYLNIINAKG